MRIDCVISVFNVGVTLFWFRFETILLIVTLRDFVFVD